MLGAVFEVTSRQWNAQVQEDDEFDEALDDLDDVIREIRATVFAARGPPGSTLRPPAVTGREAPNQLVSRWPAHGRREPGGAGRRSHYLCPTANLARRPGDRRPPSRSCWVVPPQMPSALASRA